MKCGDHSTAHRLDKRSTTEKSGARLPRPTWTPALNSPASLQTSGGAWLTTPGHVSPSAWFSFLADGPFGLLLQPCTDCWVSPLVTPHAFSGAPNPLAYPGFSYHTPAHLYQEEGKLCHVFSCLTPTLHPCSSLFLESPLLSHLRSKLLCTLQDPPQTPLFGGTFLRLVPGSLQGACMTTMIPVSTAYFHRLIQACRPNMTVTSSRAGPNLVNFVPNFLGPFLP